MNLYFFSSSVSDCYIGQFQMVLPIAFLYLTDIVFLNLSYRWNQKEKVDKRFFSYTSTSISNCGDWTAVENFRFSSSSKVVGNGPCKVAQQDVALRKLRRSRKPVCKNLQVSQVASHKKFFLLPFSHTLFISNPYRNDLLNLSDSLFNLLHAKLIYGW